MELLSSNCSSIASRSLKFPFLTHCHSSFPSRTPLDTQRSFGDDVENTHTTGSGSRFSAFHTTILITVSPVFPHFAEFVFIAAEVRAEEGICYAGWCAIVTSLVEGWKLMFVWIEEKDLIIIGGGVAGYVAAIKAGQEGLKVQHSTPPPHKYRDR